VGDFTYNRQEEMQSLRDKETQLLGKMLTIPSLSGSNALVPNGDFSDQWKVLIYDQDGRDIISPLLNVGALRQKGVTLHLQVEFEFDIGHLICFC
jgi:hypothetical protein